MTAPTNLPPSEGDLNDLRATVADLKQELSDVRGLLKQLQDAGVPASRVEAVEKTLAKYEADMKAAKEALDKATGGLLGRLAFK